MLGSPSQHRHCLGPQQPLVRTIIAIDFDGTLAVRDVAPWDMTAVFGNKQRVEQVGDWLRELKGLGSSLQIVSRNARAVIKPCVQHAGWTDLFDEIFGREDVERYSAWHGRKSVLLGKLLVAKNGLRCEDVLFVDDDASNCRDVEKHLPGMGIVHVKGKRGLESDDMQKVVAWARLRDSQAGVLHHQSSFSNASIVLNAAPPVRKSITMRADEASPWMLTRFFAK
ncbi:hypothetical protein T492DRAFT_934187 [Pavlovales sp. CCMP2436]|nr:hypothetical protein T492DRAFT_934187 [Pavlovales sp. CCMP2436]|mmetsp:Transcript_25164/g.63890  ORF Transcript_25164/g.63890 Transcript_25164/m.63890 type:complete len:225 (+) Transcript_25164:212-886(+)